MNAIAMLKKTCNTALSKRVRQDRGGLSPRDAFALAAIMVMTSPAYAQFEKAKTALDSVQTWLLSIGAVCVTLAIMFVGFRMMFQAAQWKDVAPVFWGGILVGGGSAFAALFFTS